MRRTNDTQTFSRLYCRECRKRLQLQFLYNSALFDGTCSGIASCRCSVYPIVGGIISFGKQPDSETIITSVRRRNEWKAVFALMESNTRVKLLFCIVLSLSNMLHKVRSFSAPLIQRIGLSGLVYILQYGNYPGLWGKYIVNRMRMPSYLLSQYFSSSIHRGDVVVDVGCGTGQLLSHLAQKTQPGLIYGADKSFLNLLLARVYFCSPKSTLVCCNIESGIPFATRSVDFSVATDSFHYIKTQVKFLNDISRITATTGSLALIHILNNDNIKHSNIHGLSPVKIQQILKRKFFRTFTKITNRTFWVAMKNNELLSEIRSDSSAQLECSYAISVIASRKSGMEHASLSQKEHAMMMKIPTYWALDKPLQDAVL